jgi:hypothetical protein
MGHISHNGERKTSYKICAEASKRKRLFGNLDVEQLIPIPRQCNHNLLTYVPLHASTLIGSSSGVVSYIFPFLNCEEYIHIYIRRLKMANFYVQLYFNC